MGKSKDSKKDDNKISEKWVEQFSEKFRIDKGKGFKLKDCQTASGLDLDADEAKTELEKIVSKIAKLQNVLYADKQRSLLLVFQAMDAAGKDSTIKNILSGVNPQGVDVYSFKRPTEGELDHDFLWRTNKVLPERGKIGVFNRSYYEEVLVVRVHPDILASQHLPKDLVGKNIWDERLGDISNLEDYLARNGTVILKFFLNISRDEQKKRFMERIETPEKNWKFDKNDVYERQFWDDYMNAYESAIQATSSKNAPWYVIPGDSKPFARLVVADAVYQALKSLDLKYPVLHPDGLDYLDQCKTILESEKILR